MIKLNKLLALGLSAVLAASCFAGCGGGADSGSGDASGGDAASGDKIKLTMGMWDKRQQPAMQSLIDAYTAANPNVSIELQSTSYKGGEYWTKLEASMTGGTAPDVFWMNALHVESYVEGNMLLPLDDYISKDSYDMSAFPDSLVGLYNIEGKQYAIPKDFDTNAVWYNKKMFDEAGVPYPTDDWTWDDFVETARKMTNPEKGVYGTAAPLDWQTCYYNTINAAGGWILNEDATATGYNDPNTQKGIQCWVDLITEGVSPSLADTTDTPPDSMFESEKVAMLWAGSYMTPEYMQNETVKDHIDLVEAPSFEGKKGNVINGLGYAVYVNSKQKDEAAKFALWLGGEEAMKIQGQAGAVISARKDAQKYFAEAMPHINLKAYTNQADIATAIPVCKVSAELFDLENKSLKLAFAGEATVAEACKQAAEECDALLATMN